MNKSKRTYLTKGDSMSFARYIVSDERRAKLQKEAALKAKDNVIGFTPWTMALRMITEQDYKDWKVWRDEGHDKF